MAAVRVLKERCGDCSDVSLVQIEFHKDQLPEMLQGSGVTSHTGCLYCDELLNAGVTTA